MNPSTPNRPSHSQRRPASTEHLDNLMRELNLSPPGYVEYTLVSEWAAKHVWRIDSDGKPWAYIRYLLGTPEQFPLRWRHLKLGQVLNEVKVGPRILGMLSESEALGGRAVIVEASLNPITREELESRIPEAMSLIARLHSAQPVFDALALELSDEDLSVFSPLASNFVELRERWSAVTYRWLTYELPLIDEVITITEAVLLRLVELDDENHVVGNIVPAHQDLNFGNFVANHRGVLRMIDFEELGLSTPVADLGIFLTWYVDKKQHREMLQYYPLADPDDILHKMQTWVPLRYLNISAHWAARLVHAQDDVAWEHAVSRMVEWLRGACELVFEEGVPKKYRRMLVKIERTLMKMSPQE